MATPISTEYSVAGRIRFCRQLWAYFIDVHGNGGGRGQEVGRKLESRCRRDPHICASLPSSPVLHTYSLVVDWFILCCRRIIDLGVDPGPPTESTGHIQLLPCEYV